MNKEVSANDNSGIMNNIGKSIEGYISSTKESLVDNPIVNKGSQAITSGTQIFSSAVSKVTMDNAKEVMMDTVSNSSSSIYFIIILLVLSSIVCYIIYYIIVDNVIFQKRVLIPGTETPLLCTKHTKLQFADVLDSGNGNKRSYCFWVYILDINSMLGASYRHLATITEKKNKPNDLHNSSLCARFSNKNNSLEFRFGINSSFPSSSSANVKYNDETTSFVIHSYNGQRYLSGIVIPYIPIQRWVHVGIVLNDNGGGSITTYIDGNFVETINNKTISTTNRDYGEDTIIDVSKFNLEHIGTLYVGGLETPTSDLIPVGFPGLLSRFTIFNYDLNRNDMYKEYSSGPIKGGLSSLGLSAYGIRNPVYKLDNSDPVVYY